jgi:hypothetical protein
MTNPSNLYAEKIFAEHPLALWALDDTVDYVSLITENQRNFDNWEISNGSFGAFTNTNDEPFNTSYVGKIIGNVPLSGIETTTAVSDYIINFTDMDQSLGTFSIGGYFYSQSSFLTGFELGYQYYDTTSAQLIEKTKSFSTSVSNQWQFISETFAIPSENTEIKIVVKIKYESGSVSENDYHFLVNGITLGQWSEEFNSSSLGVQPESLIGILPYEQNVISASCYGLEESFGYYCVSGNKLLAKNSGVPLVYGSSNVTNIYPNENKPSLIIPAKGFLNSIGQYKDYTAELWMRISSNCTTPKKVFGNLNGQDGLFVNGPFLILKIGDNIGSHFVGEWDRPMLVHIRVAQNNASLLINGEEVLSLTYLTSDLEFPDLTSTINNIICDNNWLGVWSYTDVTPLQVDCIALYPYKVSSVMAKRRFVYGQGVEFPEDVNSAYGGTSIAIDYSFADYTNNYSYPNIARWSQGSLDNLIIQNNILTTPDYILPDLVFDNKTEFEFYADNKVEQNESSLFFSLKPKNSWNTTNGYLLFKDFNLLKEDVRCFYGIFKAKSTAVNETLIHIDSENTENYFNISLNGSDIIYTIKYNNTEQIFYTGVGYTVGENLTVGLDLDSAINYFGSSVASFFSNRSGLKFYVGGSANLSNTFSGNIYSIGFCTDKNFQKIKSLFNENGLPKSYEDVFNLYGGPIDYDAGDTYFGDEAFYWDYILDGGTPAGYVAYVLETHTASYTLVASEYFEKYSLDINVEGSWKDYMPLTYFAQYVKNKKGVSYYDLDFLQFNILYPEPSTFLTQESAGSWSYGELKNEFSNPIQRTYASLDNHLFTGYDDYQSLKDRTTNKEVYDTSNSVIKSHITFEYLESGASAVDEFFTYDKSAPKDGILEPGTEWINTKYEVINNTIIYPPTDIDFNDLKIVFHIDFNAKSILKNKVNIKSLEVCSQAFNDSEPNPIGTKFGSNMYPYKKSGVYYDYKGKNPFVIYKGNSPYLNLTRHSGIQIKGTYDPLASRGISIPVNSTIASNYKVIAMQASLRYDDAFFSYSPTEIFEIKSKDSIIKFFMVANSSDGKRAKIYAINAKTGELENGIGFYWNGNLVKEPVITIKEWGFLGISFNNILNFSNVVGSINITGPILINNISHYQTTSLQEVGNAVKRPWFKVKSLGLLDIDWIFWLPYSWNNVLVLSSSSVVGVKPSTIYKNYTGTNKIIVGDGYDKKLSFGLYEYQFYQDVSWQTSTLNAV